MNHAGMMRACPANSHDRPAISTIPVTDEVSWSRNAGRMEGCSHGDAKNEVKNVQQTRCAQLQLTCGDLCPEYGVYGTCESRQLNVNACIIQERMVRSSAARWWEKNSQAESKMRPASARFGIWF